MDQRREEPQWVAIDDGFKPPKQRSRRKHRVRQAKKEEIQLDAGNVGLFMCKREARDPSVSSLQAEDEEGSVEYKYRLKEPNPIRLQKLITQMKFRLSEGEGECFYYIGVEDDGYPRGLDPKELQASIGVVTTMASSLSAAARVVELLPGAYGRQAAILHIRCKEEEDMDYQDLRVVVGGSLNRGKSTLVAVLTQGSYGRPLLDNGHGSARMAVFRHKHEIESGRTSSISQQMLGYDEEGKVLNYAGVATPTPAELSSAAKQVLTFIDMGGHEKYLKTTLYGLTCMLPDYMLLCVCATTGITRTTREHLAVAVALEIPVAVAITKCEAVEPEALRQVQQQVQALLDIAAPGPSSSADCNTDGAHMDTTRGPISSPAAQLGQAAAAVASAAGAGAGAGRSARPVQCTTSSDAMYTTAAPTAEVVAADDADTGGADADAFHHQHFGATLITNVVEAARAAAVLSDLRAVTGTARGASFLQASFPVFWVSSVTGQGLQLLHLFLSRLQPATVTSGSPIVSTGRDGSNAAIVNAVDGSSVQVATTLDTRTAEELQAGSSHSAQGAATNGHSSDNGVAVAGCGPAAGTDGAPALAAAAGGGGGAGGPAAGGGGGAGGPAAARGGGAGGPAAAVVVPPSAVLTKADEGHFQVAHTFDVEGVGPVVSGIAVAGRIQVGDQLLWGPTSMGGFVSVEVAGIQRSHVPVRCVLPGQTATLALSMVGEGPVVTGADHAAARAQAAAASSLLRLAEARLATGAAPGVPRGACGPLGVEGDGSSSGRPSYGGGVQGQGHDALLDSLALDLEAVDDSGEEGSGLSDAFGGWALEEAPSPSGPRRHSGSSAGSLTTAAAAGGRCEVVADTAEQGAWSLVGGSSSAPRPIPAIKLTSGSVTSLGVPPSPLGTSPGNWRKGAVLLSHAYQPRTYWSFEALLVLLGGHWPPRGLLSGGWPPNCEQQPPTPTVAVPGACVAGLVEGPAVHADAGDTGEDSPPRSPTARRRSSASTGASLPRVGAKQRASKRGEYAYVVHCNSVRQVARLESMQEVLDPASWQQHLQQQGMQQAEEGAGNRAAPCTALAPARNQCLVQQLPAGISSSIRAAAALLQAGWSPSPSDHEGGTSSGGGSSSGGSAGGAGRLELGSLGSMVQVCMRFLHRPEWLQVGSRLIIRDRADGHVAAAGMVVALPLEVCDD